MRLSRLLAVAVAAAAFAAIAPSAHAEYYLKVEGVNGDSRNPTMVGYSDIDSFDFSVEAPATPASAAGSPTGSAKFNEVTITKRVDAATPALLEKTAGGAVLAAVEVVGRQGTGVPFARYCFLNVMITEQEQKGEIRNFPTEALSFTYKLIDQQFMREGIDGVRSRPAFGGWDSTYNRPLIRSLAVGSSSGPQTCTKS